MNSAFDLYGLRIVGKGASHKASLSEVRPSRRIPSMYADPLAWLIVDAAEQALEDSIAPGEIDRSAIGHLVVSDQCTLQTMQILAQQIQAGRLSPLKFSGANPGQVAGLVMLLNALHGPSLVLSMPPDEGIAPACVIVRGWLASGQAKAAVLSLHRVETHGHCVSSLLFTQSGDQS